MRKPWDALSDPYKARLRRHGITPEQHASGVPLYRARGHTSRSREVTRARIYRFAKQHAEESERLSHDSKTAYEKAREIERFLFSKASTDAENYMNMYETQIRKMRKAYTEGDTEYAHALFEARVTDLPDYMYYYHGIFGF